MESSLRTIHFQEQLPSRWDGAQMGMQSACPEVLSEKAAEEYAKWYFCGAPFHQSAKPFPGSVEG
jgi:hypothetical protein